MDSLHVPERRCLGCGTRAPKSALARFVAAATPDGRRLVRDDRGRQHGRGLYVCPTRECFTRAVERKAFQRGAKLGGEPLAVDPALSNELAR